MATQNTNNTTPDEEIEFTTFDRRRANDLPYLTQWVDAEAKRKNITIRRQGDLFGVADLLFVFGDYKSRDVASTRWRKMKPKTDTRSSESNAQSHDFYVSYNYEGKHMDHCTISDFLEQVLPHVTGRTADIIRRARSSAATMVSTGHYVLAETQTEGEKETFDVFDERKSTDLSYLIRWVHESAVRKKVPIRRKEHPEKGSVFGAVDLMVIVGEYKDRKSASDVWRRIRSHDLTRSPTHRTPLLSVGGSELPEFVVQYESFSNLMDYIRIDDFLNIIIPRMGGDLAKKIQRARSSAATMVSTGHYVLAENARSVTKSGIDSKMGIDLTWDRSFSDAIEDTEQTDVENVLECAATSFDTRENDEYRTFDKQRSSDLTYIIRWAQYRAKSKSTEIRASKDGKRGEVYGVVDLMTIFGDYKNREAAARQWRKLKTESGTRPSGPGVKSGEFYVPHNYEGKPMDHCTIPDFLEHVLPHITGKTADIIRRARSSAATMVSTGSQMVIDLTIHNAQSIQNAPREIAEAVENIREETEASAMDIIPEEVAAFQISEEEWRQDHPHTIEYINAIPGNVFYVRKSLAHFVPGVPPPPNSSLQTNVGKLGITSDLVKRQNHPSYRRDFGVFTNIIVFDSLDHADHFEKIVKPLIVKDRTSGIEYFDDDEVATRYGCSAWDLFEKLAREYKAGHIIGIYDAEIAVSMGADKEETTQPKLSDYGFTQSVAKQQPPPTLKISVTFKQADGARRIERPRPSNGGMELQLSNNNVEISRYAYETRKVETDAQVELKRLEVESKRLELEFEAKKLDADVQKHTNEIDGKTQLEIKREELKSETTKRGLELTHEEQLVEYELRKLQINLEMETVRRGRQVAPILTDEEKADFVEFWDTCTAPSTRSVSCRALLEKYQQYTQGNLMMRVMDFNRHLKAIGVVVKRSLGNTGNGVERRAILE